MEKIALITGASRGIGKAIAHYFAQEGYSLILLALTKENLEQIETELQKLYSSCVIKTVAVDFNNPSAVESEIKSIINSYKKIDVVVNSAGILRAGNTSLTSYELSELMNVNVLSTMIICNLLAEKMKIQGFGEIYNIGSTAGLKSVPKIAAYSATKSAIISYSESLYNELLPFNINVCCLCPSVVNTDMTDDGRVDNNLKIETQDLTKCFEFVRDLSSNAKISILPIRCKVMDLETH
ncbi:SDR family NAD(P)-dependent oxidoreductase [Aliivibrio fischeri]|uniref:SDR family NAD(P)-dependent oxidoreductase n=2 Tax=Aliivibrio fischeri TaxID=668 RepID=UPI0006D29FFE|nr:SDR family NAD(P)-dependent oxidoreductase [Aliivibrio fischeri]USR97128.1 SDR family NAD(P)-dependent oxidoreductase [Aliivibrio fischeri ATCC 7744 = JCM 18803 = DSM 507]USR97137.1 SDR family NAD(P)-dependent oxidoreductase [Aliivibrio fischeri ATCC 7744 = JCM 18803 = DSM 507]